MNTHKLNEYRQALLKLRPSLREEIERRINLLPEEIIPPGDNWQEPSNSFDAEIETERAEELLYRQVNAALERIDAGTFGRCLDCGRTIPADRLDAVPYTAYCHECESRHEADWTA